MLHVTKVLFSRLIPLSMALHLRLRRETADLAFTHLSLAGKGGGWKRPPTAVGHLKDTVPALIELDCVHVDLPPVLVYQNKIRSGASRFDSEADGEQRLLQLGYIRRV